MKLQTRTLDQDHELTLERRDGRVSVVIDGRTYDLEVREIGAGEFVLVEKDEIYACLVGANSKRAQSYEVHLRGESFEVIVTDPKRLRSGQTAGSQNHGAARILAPMPGKVVRVLVEAGTEVEAGAGVVVVEAMKMQNELKAPKAGRVVSLTAAPGATVNAGEVLAVIE